MAKILSIAPGLWETRVIVMEGGKKAGKVYESFSFLNPDGIMEDGLIKNPEAFGRELKKELLKRNITVKKAVFTISSSRIASREAVIPMLKQRRIQGLLETNAAEYFPVDMSRYYMAYEILETDKEKKQYRLQITAAPRALIGTYQEAARACGLSVLRVDYVGNSVYQAMKRIFEKGVHISLKVEERTSIITIIKDGMLALQRIIPYGVETAVEIVNEYPVFRSNGTWQKALSILEETDCVCKRFDSETGDGESGQARKEITESFRYLYGNVTRIMDYYASKNPDTLFETVSIGGLGSKVKGLPELLSGELGIAIEVKDSYQACIGAGYETINLSELSQSGQKKKRQETLKGAYVVLAVCGLCSVLLIVSSLIFEGLLLHQKADYE